MRQTGAWNDLKEINNCRTSARWNGLRAYVVAFVLFSGDAHDCEFAVGHVPSLSQDVETAPKGLRRNTLTCTSYADQLLVYPHWISSACGISIVDSTQLITR